MGILNRTPRERIVDGRGRPYFLWDSDLTLAAFEAELAGGDEETRAYWVGKLMRQAKPDDVFWFVTRREIEALWPKLRRYLGRSEPMWAWLLGRWRGAGDGR